MMDIYENETMTGTEAADELMKILDGEVTLADDEAIKEPCPYCGGTPDRGIDIPENYGELATYYAVCEGCGATGPEVKFKWGEHDARREAQKKLISAWNQWSREERGKHGT